MALYTFGRMWVDTKWLFEFDLQDLQPFISNTKTTYQIKVYTLARLECKLYEKSGSSSLLEYLYVHVIQKPGNF